MKKPVIMVVDDEIDIRELAADFLKGVFKNYEIVICADGELAWQAITKYGWRTDLMITDLIMPRMDGMTLLKKVREQYPEVRVIMITGEKDAEKEAIENGVDVFLQKPSTLKQLQEAVQKLLS